MPDGAPERLQIAHNQVLRDNEAQDDHAQRTQKLETELADTEYKMQQKEASLAMAAEEMVKLLKSTAFTQAKADLLPLWNQSRLLHPLYHPQQT